MYIHVKRIQCLCFYTPEYIIYRSNIHFIFNSLINATLRVLYIPVSSIFMELFNVFVVICPWFLTLPLGDIYLSLTASIQFKAHCTLNKSYSINRPRCAVFKQTKKISIVQSSIVTRSALYCKTQTAVAKQKERRKSFLCRSIKTIEIKEGKWSLEFKEVFLLTDNSKTKIDMLNYVYFFKNMLVVMWHNHL